MRTSIVVPCFGLLSIAAAIHTSDHLVGAAFGRRDLLWVATFCALSVAVWGVFAMRTVRGRIVGGVLACAVMVWALGVIGIGGGAKFAGDPVAAWHAALVGLCAAGLLLTAAGRRRGACSGESRSVLPAVGVTVLLVLAAVAYGHSVASASRDQLVEALQSERIVRARQLAGVVRVIHPRATVMDVPLEELIPALDDEQQRLTALLARPLPARPTSAVVGARAVLLMKLDRNRQALELLQSLTGAPAQAPVALDYCGLCCQRLGEWSSSRDWYAKSQRFWEDQPAGPQRTQALASACKGIAFAERRLNHPLRAEQAYLDALAVSPDADTHFLLALLYEQQQQTRRAEHHAHAAAALAPAAYSESSRQLCDRMALSHFGCSQVTLPGHPSSHAR